MIRFILIVILFLISLLCVFKAFTYHLWIASILVSEFPWIFMCIAGGLLAWGIAPQKFQLAGNVLCVLTLLILLSPVVRAKSISNSLQQELASSLGKRSSEQTDSSSQPFQFFKMISGIGAKQISFQSFTYSLTAENLTLDFYPSVIKGNRPIVIVIHGGSWASGDSQQLPELNSELARQGFHVASINYRLAPQYKNPAPTEDVKAAMDYLRMHSSKLNIDTTQFILLGRSAGAQIALLSAYKLHDPSIKGVISFYGPADMVWGYSLPSNPLVMDSRKVMEDFLGGTYEQVPQNYEASSPVHAADKNSPTTLMIHGQNDVLVAYEHSIRLSKKLTLVGVKHHLLTLPWATHGCDYTLNGPGGQLSTYSVLYFLKQVTH